MSADRLIAVFGSSRTEPDSTEWDDAFLVGKLVGEAGFGVVTGGYGGTMEAASAGAATAGARVVGVIAPALFRTRHGANQHVTEIVEANTLSERIGFMTERSAGIVVLAGSIGTVAELVVAWHTNHIGRRHGIRQVPTVAVGPQWQSLREVLTGDLGANDTDIHWADDPPVRCLGSSLR